MGKRFIDCENDYIVYNDETLDFYIGLLDIISANSHWKFFETLTNYHDSFIFYDCNELTYRLYCYARKKGIPYEIRNFSKWQRLYGVTESEKQICADNDNLHSPILFSEETRRTGHKKDKKGLPFPNTCFNFLNTIFKANIFIDCFGQDYFSMFLKQNGVLAEQLPVESAYVLYLNLKPMTDDDKVPRLLKAVRQATSKKIAGILCNCQGEILFQMLLKQKCFLKNYYVLLLPPLYYIKEKSISCICEGIFHELDLFIYQFVKPTFYQPFFATQNIIPMLKNKCRRICIPDLYFDGYFPQISHIEKPANALLRDLNGDTIFQVRDNFIERTYEQTKSIRKTKELLLSEINSGMVFDNKMIINHWNHAVARMMDAEKNVDLKISDYLLDHIKKRRLFVAAHNPVNELMYVEIERLMELLDLPFDPFEYRDGIMNFEGAQEVIYPYVKTMLELDFKTEQYYINKSFVDRQFKIEEYIELYIRNICELE